MLQLSSARVYRHARNWKPSALAEAGDLIQPIQQGIIQEEDIHAEIGELVLERKQGRTRSEQRLCLEYILHLSVFAQYLVDLNSKLQITDTKQ